MGVRLPTSPRTQTCWPEDVGLLTTLGYQIGDQKAVYALEGSIAITGALVQWLRDNLGLIEMSGDIEHLARGASRVLHSRRCPIRSWWSRTMR